MALKLTLKPGERVAINSAVIVNGDRRTTFVIENQASVLRERDIMKPEDATTPAKRIYLPIMMMAIDPNARADVIGEFEQRLTEFAGAISDKAALGLCATIAAKVANRDYYKALSHCRELVAFERTRLANVA